MIRISSLNYDVNTVSSTLYTVSQNQWNTIASLSDHVATAVGGDLTSLSSYIYDLNVSFLSLSGYVSTTNTSLMSLSSLHWNAITATSISLSNLYLSNAATSISLSNLYLSNAATSISLSNLIVSFLSLSSQLTLSISLKDNLYVGGTASIVSINVNAGQIYNNTANGRVGINTSVPQAAFDVVGITRIRTLSNNAYLDFTADVNADGNANMVRSLYASGGITYEGTRTYYSQGNPNVSDSGSINIRCATNQLDLYTTQSNNDSSVLGLQGFTGARCIQYYNFISTTEAQRVSATGFGILVPYVSLSNLCHSVYPNVMAIGFNNGGVDPDIPFTLHCGSGTGVGDSYGGGLQVTNHNNYSLFISRLPYDVVFRANGNAVVTGSISANDFFVGGVSSVNTLFTSFTSLSGYVSSTNASLMSLSDYISNTVVSFLSLSAYTSTTNASLMSLSNYISSLNVSFLSLSAYTSTTNASLMSLSNYISSLNVSFLSLSAYTSTTNASLMSLSNYISSLNVSFLSLSAYTSTINASLMSLCNYVSSFTYGLNIATPTISTNTVYQNTGTFPHYYNIWISSRLSNESFRALMSSSAITLGVSTGLVFTDYFETGTQATTYFVHMNFIVPPTWYLVISSAVNTSTVARRWV